MFKFFSILLIGLLYLGCGPEKEPSVSHKMFQSVQKKDATLLQVGKDKLHCSRCGMNLVKFYKTSHAATLNNKKYQYCSIHCLEDHFGEGVRLKNPKVVDIASLKFISIAEAHYVVGSKKRGTMSRVSKYAFSSIEDARKFQKQYGGEIMDYKGALQKAKEDFKHYK